MIQFWATWCGFCRRDQPAVEQIVAFYKDKLVVLAVSVRESEAAVKRYLAESPRRSRIVLHDQTNLVAQFRPEAFPCYVMIDAQGGIVGDQQGAGGIEALRALVARAGL